jgi:hypothetical protein
MKAKDRFQFRASHYKLPSLPIGNVSAIESNCVPSAMFRDFFEHINQFLHNVEWIEYYLRELHTCPPCIENYSATSAILFSLLIDLKSPKFIL